jgi:hypothetical protein
LNYVVQIPPLYPGQVVLAHLTSVAQELPLVPVACHAQAGVASVLEVDVQELLVVAAWVQVSSSSSNAQVGDHESTCQVLWSPDL